MEVVHIRTDINDLADELMTNGHRDGDRLACPFIPIKDMNVRAAYTRSQNTNEDVINADRRLGDFLQPKARLRMRFNECFHIKDGNSEPLAALCIIAGRLTVGKGETP